MSINANTFSTLQCCIPTQSLWRQLMNQHQYTIMDTDQVGYNDTYLINYSFCIWYIINIFKIYNFSAGIQITSHPVRHILLGLLWFSVNNAYKLDCYCTELTHTLNGKTHFISHSLLLILGTEVSPICY